MGLLKENNLHKLQWQFLLEILRYFIYFFDKEVCIRKTKKAQFFLHLLSNEYLKEHLKGLTELLYKNFYYVKFPFMVFNN